MKINIYYDQVKFRLKDTKSKKEFLIKVIRSENKIPGDLNFIFTDDETLLDLNSKYLKHNCYTDVISFAYNYENTVNGEIYISIERVKKNSAKYNVGFNEEVFRVMIHGVLHLCGYSDKLATERDLMIELQEKKVNEYVQNLKWNSGTI